MSKCFETAMIAAQFGTDGTSPCNLFMVNEAEAAAATALYARIYDLIVCQVCEIPYGRTHNMVEGREVPDAGLWWWYH
jgi:hypothetical protein